MISSELPELMRLSDRIVVMREGRLVGELPGLRTGDTAEAENDLAAKIMAMVARSAVKVNRSGNDEEAA